MRTFKFVVINFILVFALTICMSISKAEAQQTYLGEFCWQTFDDVGAPATFYKFGVYANEGGHFVLYGTDSLTDAAHGNAEIVGSEVKLTIVISGRDGSGGGFSEIFNASLDISTLSGTWRSVGDEYDGSNNRDEFIERGTITRITCP